MISLAVWRLDGEAAYPWRCERCELHGIAEHGIDDDEDAERDSAGAYLSGDRIARTGPGRVSAIKLRACPEADLERVGDLLQLWRLGDGELHRVSSLIGGTPSAAMVDAWDALACEMGGLRSMLNERARKTASKGRN